MPILQHIPKLIACAVIVVLTTRKSYSLPINSDLGLTPHKGEFIIRAQTRYTVKGDDPTSQDREQDIYSVPLFLYMALPPKLRSWLKFHLSLKSYAQSTLLTVAMQG